MKNTSRRSFLKKTTGSLFAASAFGGGMLKAKKVMSQTEKFRGTLKKSLYWGMLPESLSTEEKFKVIKRAGYEGVEVPTIEDPAQVDEFKQAASETGIKIHSIMNSKHWRYPFSSSDPEMVKTGMEGMKTSLDNARAFGADTVLLVPAVVNPETSYKDAYVRSQKYIRELLPLEKELNIIIAIENVWNKFLLSPLELARYVDEFESPYLKAYFDCGNIALYGYPHDWIRTLGRRIVNVHIKGFHVKEFKFVNLGDGTIDWLEVRRAFSDIGYSGYMGAELKSGDEAYLTDVRRRMDQIIAGRNSSAATRPAVCCGGG